MKNTNFQTRITWRNRFIYSTDYGTITWQTTMHTVSSLELLNPTNFVRETVMA